MEERSMLAGNPKSTGVAISHILSNKARLVKAHLFHTVKVPPGITGRACVSLGG